MRRIEVTSAHFRGAVLLADRYPIGLRAGDALHLAVAADAGAVMATLDRRMAEAGKALGIPADLV